MPSFLICLFHLVEVLTNDPKVDCVRVSRMPSSQCNVGVLSLRPNCHEFGYVRAPEKATNDEDKEVHPKFWGEELSRCCHPVKENLAWCSVSILNLRCS